MALLIHSPEISTQKVIIFSRRKNSTSFKKQTLLRVGSNTKAEVRFEVQNVSLYGQFTAPVKVETKKSKEEEEKENYYVNMGYAIRTLREELPEMFCRELCFDIYRDDIAFKDPVNTFMGIENYKSIFWALRFHGRIFFRGLWIDIMRVWQPADDVIMVRWTVHGIPRIPWDGQARFDGTSEYKLDKNGKIFQHKVDNIAHNSPTKFRVLGVDELMQAIGCPSTPKPTYFEGPSSSSSSCFKRK